MPKAKTAPQETLPAETLTPPAEDQAEAPAAEPKLTVADVLNPDEWYPLLEIERKLAIPLSELNAAFKDGAFGQYVGHPELALLGRDVAAWIARKNIAYEVTPEAAAFYRKVQQAKAAAVSPAPGPERPKSWAERVRDMTERVADGEADEERRERESALQFYLQRLLAGEEGTDQQARELAEAAHELGLSPQQVAEDLQTVEKARRLAALHDDQPAVNEKRIAAHQTLEETKRRHKRELDEVDKTYRHADGRYRRCLFAAQDLQALARKRPALFDDGNPPRLLRVE